ncbi:unnamed protein product [Periconia digitata]|uniref:C2H2-type domain-containing protein n=1 Tax=Periconia digitata TaxID=1303443 RepID=A0A9W4XVP6_9PLEO|nr:unnamed protein product [Periconia digitata]
MDLKLLMNPSPHGTDNKNGKPRKLSEPSVPSDATFGRAESKDTINLRYVRPNRFRYDGMKLPNTVSNHLISMHNCPCCDKAYPTMNDLELHYLTSHACCVYPRFKCLRCGQRLQCFQCLHVHLHECIDQTPLSSGTSLGNIYAGSSASTTVSCVRHGRRRKYHDSAHNIQHSPRQTSHSYPSKLPTLKRSNSASSFGSANSGVSHPPRTEGRKLRKVVDASFSDLAARADTSQYSSSDSLSRVESWADTLQLGRPSKGKI